MKKLFFLMSLLLFFTIGCKNNNNEQNKSTDEAVTDVVNKLYKTYGKPGSTLYKPFTKDLFYHELEDELKKAIDITKKNNKSSILEGSIFTGDHNNFYSSYKIKDIKVMESTNPLGTAAEVVIEFESPKIKWTDKIFLVSPFDTNWKIKNIEYDHEISKEKDLKTSLNNYISEEEK